MRWITLILSVFFSVEAHHVFSQAGLYDINTIREIHIQFAFQDWKHVLDSIFQAEGDAVRLPADVTIDGKTLRNAGVRYKGYSSWNLDEIKNPFNIELDYCIKNQNYMGYTKLKLSNVIHDPSFIREVLAYEIARKYMPAPEANYANLYINDSLIGLYTSVEAVDDLFIQKHFPPGGNSFFKGEPETLKYPFGENANLACTHGDDSSGYFDYYKLESAYGWNDLFNLIRVLNNEPDNVEKVLNVDQALWMHAFNFTLLNLDSYIGYAQNYYLYKDNNHRFNPVIWDLNMSFGSFRESDGSYHFLGLSIPEIKTLDPLEHLSFCVSPRPLMTKLFENDRYRKIYLAHMRTIVKENFLNREYLLRGEEIQNLIDGSVKKDPNKFYSYDDFHENLFNTVGGTGSMMEYPGIEDLVEARVACLDTFPGFHGEPAVSEVSHLPEYPRQNEMTRISVYVEGADEVLLAYRFLSSGIFVKTKMYDDGNYHDGKAGDHVYGAEVTLAGDIMQYYIYAENETAAAFSPERAETEYYSIQSVIGKGDLVINEIQAAGGESGSYGWIELFNTISEDLNLKGCGLSDDHDTPGKWKFPDTLIRGKNYMIVRDMRSSGISLSADFVLSAGKGELLLLNAKDAIIDSVKYGQQFQGKSIGRYPNGYGPFMYMLPSFSSYNHFSSVSENDVELYPNPARTEINLEIRKVNQPVSIRIYNSVGQIAREEDYFFSSEMIPVIAQTINISDLAKGIYFIQITCAELSVQKKFIIF